MVLKQEKTEELDLSFSTFVRNAMDGKFRIHNIFYRPFTYETWVRYQTVIRPLELEYVSAQCDWVEKGLGNFYDWMAEFKGIKLTEEEQSKRMQK